MNIISCDEVGSRVLGFTVNGQPMAIEQIQAHPATLVWASAVELLVWLSRTPGYWGEFATSASFLVLTNGQVVETEVRRCDVQQRIDRDELLPA